MEEMTLKEVCNKVGVTRRAVQCYEQEELVSSTGKNKYGYLLYDDVAVKRIQEIKMYQEFGFALKDIKVLFVSSEEEYMDFFIFSGVLISYPILSNASYIRSIT